MNMLPHIIFEKNAALFCFERVRETPTSLMCDVYSSAFWLHAFNLMDYFNILLDYPQLAYKIETQILTLTERRTMDVEEKLNLRDMEYTWNNILQKLL